MTFHSKERSQQFINVQISILSFLSLMLGDGQEHRVRVFVHVRADSRFDSNPSETQRSGICIMPTPWVTECINITSNKMIKQYQDPFLIHYTVQTDVFVAQHAAKYIDRGTLSPIITTGASHVLPSVTVCADPRPTIAGRALIVIYHSAGVIYLKQGCATWKPSDFQVEPAHDQVRTRSNRLLRRMMAYVLNDT